MQSASIVSFSSEESKEDKSISIPHDKDSFENWGKTVKNQPDFTFYPKNIEHIQEIVKQASKLGKRVRVSAYQHSWSNIYSYDGDYLISLLRKKETEVLPAIHQPLDGSNAFQFVKPIATEFQENGKWKHLIKVGAATTNEQFRVWANEYYYKNGHSWTPPLNVIMVENTMIGVMCTMGHGAGILHPTFADLVVEIEFINAEGELQKIGYNINDPYEKQKEARELLKSAVSFGMIGVITSVTFKFDLMTHAVMDPIAKSFEQGIPYPKDYKISKAIPQGIFEHFDEKKRQQIEKEFIKNCETSYYAEFFGFIKKHKPACLIHVWNNDGDSKKSVPYPSPLTIKRQEIESTVAEISNHSVMRLLPSAWQTELLSRVTLLSIDQDRVTTSLINAIHFRHGIQNMRVQNMEWEIPIPLLPNGKLDWSICQRAWWDTATVIYEWYEKTGSMPLRLPFEMRIMGGSEVTLAAQKGNRATCSIEVLTMELGLVDQKELLGIMQALVDKWATYTDHSGAFLNIRPHWAKQWKGLKVRGKDVIDYLKEDAYKDAIPVFLRHLERIAELGGYSSKKLEMFSNPFLNYIFYAGLKKEIETEIHHVEHKAIKEEDFKSTPRDSEKIVNILKLIEDAERTHASRKYKKKLSPVKESKDIVKKDTPVEEMHFSYIHNWFNENALTPPVEDRSESVTDKCLPCAIL